MRWLPDYGVGIVALGNLTYTSWGGVIEQAFDALARTGGLAARAPEPAAALLALRDQVGRLVGRWDDALADSIAAMNLYLDEPKDRRRRAIEKLRVEAGEGCRNEGPIDAENALRGRWRMRCGTGALDVSITLAPTEPPRVQFLDVSAAPPEETPRPGACR
jgi:hypothetical protein